jgi:hypothetical protein
MATLVKAQLQEVKPDQVQTVKGSAIPVQFNPASLSLKLTNQSSGGRSRGRQARQNNGQSSTVLSMDLIFDSADEGTDAAPVSVREKTNRVERFVLPNKETSAEPPLLRFEWDKIIIVGIVESLDINFDHFAANGAPLRAKMSLSIKEQEPGYAYLEIGKGKKDSGDTEDAGKKDKNGPGEGTNDPAGDTPKSDRSDTALDGETAAEFLARQGLDPAAWRGLDVDLSAGLSLEAGIEVGFSASLGVGFGVGVSVGVMAEVGVSLEASLGFGASAVLSAGAGASANAAVSAGLSASAGSTKSTSSSSKKVNGNDAGKALSAAGGIQSAIETVKINETQAVSAEAQSAFGIQAAQVAQVAIGGASTGANSAASPASSVVASAAKVSYSPLATNQQTTASGKQPDAGASKISLGTTTPPKADPRATSYGYGVPLQPLYAAALAQEQLRLCPRNDNGLRDDNGPRFRQQRTTSPWVALPQRDKTRAFADQTESVRVRQKRKCGPG